MNNPRLKFKFMLLGLPAFAGFIVLYIYPFIRTLWFSMIDNTFQRNFVFMDNYRNVLGNSFFRLAMRNTFIFSVVGVFAIVSLSLALSFGIWSLKGRFGFIKNLFIAPMVLPTASVVFVWHLAFNSDRYFHMTRHAVGAGFWAVLPVYLLFIWKNTGINIIILGAALSGVDEQVKEAACLDGASGFKLHRYITLPLIVPSLNFVVVLSFVNSLGVFRESFLFFGTRYPPDTAYTVQYWMNNNFQRLNYPSLTAGSVMFTILISIILLAAYIGENKYSENIY